MFGWALTLLCAAIFAAFQLYFGPALEAMAGGLPQFDARVTGYSVAEARAYLAAITPEGRAYYLGTFQALDFVFPAALALWIWLPLRRLTGTARLLWLVPLAYVGLDYAENLSIRVMLQSPVSDSFIARTSALSQAKWAFALVGLVLAAVMWMRRAR